MVVDIVEMNKLVVHIDSDERMFDVEMVEMNKPVVHIDSDEYVLVVVMYKT